MTKFKFRELLRALVRYLRVAQDPQASKAAALGSGRKAAKIIKELVDWYDKEHSK